jgi:hypothetical protein
VSPPISNFAFLRPHDAQLVQLGVKAERYFRDDPATAVIKLRSRAFKPGPFVPPPEPVDATRRCGRKSPPSSAA